MVSAQCTHQILDEKNSKHVTLTQQNDFDPVHINFERKKVKTYQFDSAKGFRPSIIFAHDAAEPA
jgi:hypothetical protein